MGAENGVYHVELCKLPPWYLEGERMDAVFESDDGGAKSRQSLESGEAVQLLLNRFFRCTSELLIGYHRNGEL